MSKKKPSDWPGPRRTDKIKWDKFDKDESMIIEKCAESLIPEERFLAISSMTRLTYDEVQELCPNPSDAKKLEDLLKIVKSSQSSNDKINDIAVNIEKFGSILITLLDKLL